jgi:Tol biopolymer transport system component
MRTTLRSIVLSLTVLVFCVGLSAAQPAGPAPEFSCDYLGQEPPGDTPVVFAPDILGPVGYRYRLAISPRGDEMFFSGDNNVLYRLRYDASTKIWAGPEPSQFNGGESSFSPDGRRLYFINRDPARGSKVALNVWYVERGEAGEWSGPKTLGSPVWDQTVHTPVVAANGNLYATGIIRLRFVDGKYQPAEQLVPPVKGGHPTIAPDESFLLFDAPQPESRKTDLYVVYHKPDGTWTRPASLGSPINTPERESNPTISPDGKYLFFTRHGKIHWVSAGVLERLKDEALGRGRQD